MNFPNEPGYYLTVIGVIITFYYANRHKLLESKNKKEELFLKKEELRKNFLQEKINTLISLEIENKFIDLMKLSDDILIEKSKSILKTKHLAYINYKVEQTTLEQNPISEEEKNYYLWVAKALYSFRIILKNKTNISENDILNIIVVCKRQENCSNRIAQLQSIYKKRPP